MLSESMLESWWGESIGRDNRDVVDWSAVSAESPSQSRPIPDELDGLIAGVIYEVRSHLATDRWALRLSKGTVVAAYAAAALAHCCELAEELVDAHRVDREMTGRLLARALFESWVVGYYVQLGGMDALMAVGADHAFARQTFGRAMEEHDTQLRRRLKKIRDRNRRIEQTNQGIAIWNERNPNAPKPLHDLIPEPSAVFADLAMDDFMSSVPDDLEPKSLPLFEMIKRLSPITRSRGNEETYELSYHYAYRSLSMLGAHANLWVLETYLDNRDGRAVFLRIRDSPQVQSSFSEPNRETALLLLSALSVAVFERGPEPKVAAAVLARYEGGCGP